MSITASSRQVRRSVFGEAGLPTGPTQSLSQTGETLPLSGVSEPPSLSICTWMLLRQSGVMLPLCGGDVARLLPPISWNNSGVAVPLSGETDRLAAF
jgi:hypothetical protein